MVDGKPFTVARTYSYDGAHRVEAVSTSLPPDPALGDLSAYEYTQTLGYDAIGQPTTMGLPAVGTLAAETVTTSYNLMGAPIGLSVGAKDLVTDVAYNAVGQLSSRVYGNGVTRSLTWSPVDGLLDEAQASYVDGGGATVSIQYDKFRRDVSTGALTSIEDLVTRTSATGGEYTVSQCFDYDGFDRLAAAWTIDADVRSCDEAAPAGDDAFWAVDTTGYATAWTYTPSGKIDTRTTWSAVETVGSATVSSYTYGDGAHAHAVTGVDGTVYAYDGAGRMTTRTGGTGGLTLAWDVLSNLTEATIDGTSETYLYDAAGQRVAIIGETTATAFLGTTEVTDLNTATAGSLVASRYYMLGATSIAVRDSGGVNYVFADVQGSATVTMADGDVNTAEVRRNAYTPYGSVRGGDNIVSSRGWLGQVEDTTTGLTYLNARYYDPALGRFLSPDPIVDFTAPNTLDRFRYADNNPVMLMDPSGLGPELAAGCYASSCSYVERVSAGAPVYGNPVTGGDIAYNKTTGGVRAPSGSASWTGGRVKSVTSSGVNLMSPSALSAVASGARDAAIDETRKLVLTQGTKLSTDRIAATLNMPKGGGTVAKTSFASVSRTGGTMVGTSYSYSPPVSGPKVSVTGLSTVVKAGGAAVGVASVGLAWYDSAQAGEDAAHQAARTGVAAASVLAAAGAGALLGSVVPVAGTAVGFAVGLVVGVGIQVGGNLAIDRWL